MVGNRIVYQADKEMEDYYREKATQTRRRGRKSRHRRHGAKNS